MNPGNNRTIKVFITDDHAIVRQGLSRIVQKEPDMEVVGEATNTREALEHLAFTDTDVLLLDIRMPGRSGLDVIQEIKASWPRIAIIVLSIFSAERLAVRAISSGAACYMTKDSDPKTILKNIRLAAHGQSCISAEMEALVAKQRSKQQVRESEALTKREYQVLNMVAIGRSTKEIATDLSLSTRTISSTITRVLGKLKLQDKAGIIKYVIKSGREGNG